MTCLNFTLTRLTTFTDYYNFSYRNQSDLGRSPCGALGQLPTDSSNESKHLMKQHLGPTRRTEAHNLTQPDY
eukprot:6014737-Amphidinium_carterae.2